MKFTKQIIRPGKYSVPRPGGERSVVEVTADRIRKWVDTFKQMVGNGLKVHAPWKHNGAVPTNGDPADPRNNAGYWEDLWAGPDGGLYGRLDVPLDDDAKKVGETVTEVSLESKPEFVDGEGRLYVDPITHIALVQHPVVPGQQNFQSEPVLALSLSLLTEADPLQFAVADDAGGGGTSSKTAGIPSNATGVSMQDVLAALKAVDLVLPEDTTAENLAERIITAAKAIAGKKAAEEGGANGEQPKEQPMPIAMSLDANPEAKKVLEFASGFVRQSYQDRINALPPVMQQQIKPYLDGFSLSLDEEGKAMPTELDRVLASMEKIAADAQFVGVQKTGRIDPSKPLQGLRLAYEEPHPDYGGSQAMTEERAEEVTKEQLKAAGRSTE